MEITGVTTYVIAWMLQTHSMAPSLIYTVSFPFIKLYKKVSVKAIYAVQAVPNIPLGPNI